MQSKFSMSTLAWLLVLFFTIPMLFNKFLAHDFVNSVPVSLMRVPMPTNLHLSSLRLLLLQPLQQQC